MKPRPLLDSYRRLNPAPNPLGPASPSAPLPSFSLHPYLFVSLPPFWSSPNSFKTFQSQAATFSPTLRPHKSFSCNTYGSPRKCCQQKTYVPAKSFSCNTYKKRGEGGGSPQTVNFQPSPLFDCRL